MNIHLSCCMLAGMMVLGGCASGTDEDTTGYKSPSVSEIIFSRRSIRKYEPRRIEPEKIKQIATCGIWAPNGQGRESWQVRMVSNVRLLAEMDARYGKPCAYGAPAVAFIACDTEYDLSQVDCGLLGGNMILAAQSMGIGSCCLGGLARFLNQPENADLLKRLNFPEGHRLLYAIAFGYPGEKPFPKARHTDRVKYID